MHSVGCGYDAAYAVDRNHMQNPFAVLRKAQWLRARPYLRRCSPHQSALAVDGWLAASNSPICGG